MKTFGGKYYLARRIIALFPEHHTYVEPFVGGGSVLLNKPPSEVEIAGDLNYDLIMLWRFIKNHPTWLSDELRNIPYNEPMFRLAEKWIHCEHEHLRSVGFLIRNRFSRGGLAKDFAWSDRLRGGKPGDSNAWDTIRAELPTIAKRVKHVRFAHNRAIEVINQYDAIDALHFCDPPYLHETRTTRDAYSHEMTRENHASLLDHLRCCRGAVALSGYRSDLYDSALADWTRHDFPMPCHAGQGKTKNRRVECVWVKPAGRSA